LAKLQQPATEKVSAAQARELDQNAEQDELANEPPAMIDD